MAKINGIPCQIQIDDSGGTARDISSDITNFTFNTPHATQDATGVDKSAIERLLLLSDGKCTFNGIVDTASNKSHDVLKTVTSTSVQRTVRITLPPATSGAPEVAMEMYLTDYNISRSQTGELTFTCNAELMDGTVPTWGTKT